MLKKKNGFCKLLKNTSETTVGADGDESVFTQKKINLLYLSFIQNWILNKKKTIDAMMKTAEI